jgi:hypothetical protein
MNMKVKTSIILLFTLLIGIMLGVFLDRTIMRIRFQQKFHEVRKARGITRLLENLIRPDESQYEAVKNILEKYSKRLHAQREKSFQQMDAVMDSLRAELDQILTDEQKARLKKDMERMKGMRERGPMPPPPKPFDREHNRPPDMDEGQPPPFE